MTYFCAENPAQKSFQTRNTFSKDEQHIANENIWQIQVPLTKSPGKPHNSCRSHYITFPTRPILCNNACSCQVSEQYFLYWNFLDGRLFYCIFQEKDSLGSLDNILTGVGQEGKADKAVHSFSSSMNIGSISSLLPLLPSLQWQIWWVNLSKCPFLCKFRMLKKEIILQPCLKFGKRCKEVQEKEENGTLLWIWHWWN